MKKVEFNVSFLVKRKHLKEYGLSELVIDYADEKVWGKCIAPELNDDEVHLMITPLDSEPNFIEKSININTDCDISYEDDEFDIVMKKLQLIVDKGLFSLDIK